MKKNKNIKILITISMVIISLFIFIKETNLKKNEIFAYNISQNTDYKVYIKPNEFIGDRYLEKDNIYVSNMVDYININFNYNYDASKMAELQYNYDIIAILYIDYTNNNQNLLKKQYDIIRDKFLKLDNSNKIAINETININYNDYNDEVLRFKEKYNLPVKAYLKIYFIVKTNINLEKTIEKQAISEINIELNQPVFGINEKNNGEGYYQISKQGEDIRNINKAQILISIILFIFGVIYFIILIRHKFFTKEKIYEINLNSILKKYSDIIVELRNTVDLTGYKIIEVKNFFELVDVEEEIRAPILYYKEEKFKSVFFIMDNQFVYRYIFEKGKNF